MEPEIKKKIITLAQIFRLFEQYNSKLNTSIWEEDVNEIFSGIEGVKSPHWIVVGYKLDDSSLLKECRGTKMGGKASLERPIPKKKNFLKSF